MREKSTCTAKTDEEKNEMLAAKCNEKNPFLPANKIIIIALKSQKNPLYRLLNYVEVTACGELFSLLFTLEQCHKLKSSPGDNAAMFLFDSIAFYLHIFAFFSSSALQVTTFFLPLSTLSVFVFLFLALF